MRTQSSPSHDQIPSSTASVRPIIAAAENIPFAFAAVTDRKHGGQIVAVNQRLCNLCECDNSDQLMDYTGGTFKGLVVPEDYPSVLSKIEFDKKNNRVGHGSMFYRIQTRTGKRLNVEDTGILVHDPELGDIFTLYISVTDERLNRNVFDPITGLHQADYVYRWLREQIAYNRPSLQNRPLAVVHMHCRDFRAYNDTFGREAGNALLKDLGALINKCFNTDLSARVYADQFIAFCDSDDAEEDAVRFHKEAAKLRTDFTLWVECGICYLDDWNTTPEEGADRAKIACDTIKASSNDYVNVYTAQLAEHLGRQERIQTFVGEAIKNGWVRLYFQPVVRALSRKVCSLEALARWDDPVLGMVSPAEFVPALEEKNLSWQLAKFVVDEAAHTVRKAIDKNIGPVPISINFSRRDFNVIDPFEEVEAAVARYDIPRDLLCIEITESTAMESPAVVKRAIAQFHEAGYEVWMDDFGSAYSSLNTLKDFDFDEIKLDMVFMRDLNDRSRIIVSNCISMAKEMGIHTLCEGVETDEQVKFLLDHGCERNQGYHCSPPRPAKELIAFLKKQGYEWETPAERKLYDAAGTLKFDPNSSWMLTICHKEEISQLYCSPSLVSGSLRRGIPELLKESRLDRSSDPFARRITTVVTEALRSGEREELNYFLNGHYYALSATVVAREGDDAICRIRFRDTTEESRQLLLASADPIAQALVNMYEGIYKVDVNAQELTIISSAFSREQPGRSFKFSIESAGQLIYEKDRTAFISWLNRVADELRTTGHIPQAESQAFRLNNPDGTHPWEVITIAFVPDRAHPQVLLCLRPLMYVDEEQGLKVAHAIIDDLSTYEDQEGQQD